MPCALPWEALFQTITGNIQIRGSTIPFTATSVGSRLAPIRDVRFWHKADVLNLQTKSGIGSDAYIPITRTYFRE